MPPLVSIALVPLLVGSAAGPPVSTTPQGRNVTAPSAQVVKLGPDNASMQCIKDAGIIAARKYASSRPGAVSFAVNEGGEIRSWKGGRTYRSASVVKAMLLVADLRRLDRLNKPLDSAERSRLGSMIHVSDNVAATATFNLVGSTAVRAVARAAGMTHYSVAWGWGTSQVSASDQSRLMLKLDELLPARSRQYARSLLRSIAHDQTWGGAPVARSHGYSTMFKSGWLPRTDGWVVHQSLRLERGNCKIGVSILTGQQSSMATGIESMRGVMERLL